MNGKTRGWQAFTAVLLLVAVLVVGGLLARHAYQVQAELSKSQLLEKLTAPSEKGRLAQVLADPESSEMLMKYIDSMAGAVSNMELSPKWNIGQFFTLLDAAKECGVKMLAFDYDSGGESLDVYCRDGDRPAFVGALETSSAFTSVEEIKSLDNLQEYTIHCRFA